MIVVMVRIPVGSADEGDRLEERFRQRMGAVDSLRGFVGFELLKGANEYISVTRFASQTDLDRWTASQSYAQAHTPRPTAPTSGGHPQADAGAASQARGNVPASSTLVYEVVIPAGDN